MRKHFMICVDNRGYESSLEKRKLYEVLTDKTAEIHHQLRVIDESGEDYLYPDKFLFPCAPAKYYKRKAAISCGIIG
jgi:hypothetical protein